MHDGVTTLILYRGQSFAAVVQKACEDDADVTRTKCFRRRLEQWINGWTVSIVRGAYAEALRGILNAGYKKTGVYRMSDNRRTPDGETWEPTQYRVFCPKAIARAQNIWLCSTSC